MTFSLAFQLTVDLPNAFGFSKSLRLLIISAGLILYNDVIAIMLQQMEFMLF
jgi:hypothetical protein